MLKFRLGFPPFLVRAGSESCPFQKFSRYLRMVRSMKPRASRAGGESQPIIFNQSINMAKGNMLLGFSRGSVGDLTFYRRNAQQITRARARVVKNPKTLQQQMQRTIMRTSVEAYKVLKEICDHSWEGVLYGANSYAEFQKHNMAMLRRLAAESGEDTKSFVPSGFKGLAAMPFVVSSGSLAFVAPAYRDNLLKWNKVVPVEEPANMTYADFASYIGAQPGDQVTFIVVRDSLSAGVDEPFGVEMVVARVILQPSEGEFSETAFLDPVDGSAGLYAVNAPNVLNEGNVYFGFESPTGMGQIMSATVRVAGNAINTMAGCAILSRKSASNVWLRSKAILGYDENFRENGYTLRQASMVVSNDIVVPSDWYLNNANEISGE